jgi:hypothetical protein
LYRSAPKFCFHARILTNPKRRPQIQFQTFSASIYASARRCGDEEMDKGIIEAIRRSLLVADVPATIVKKKGGLEIEAMFQETGMVSYDVSVFAKDKDLSVSDPFILKRDNTANEWGGDDARHGDRPVQKRPTKNPAGGDAPPRSRVTGRRPGAGG